MKLGDGLPWDEIEKIYNAHLKNERKGAGNKPARMVVGALIIKHEMRLSNEDTVEIIKENHYMQYMLGLSEFSDFKTHIEAYICRFGVLPARVEVDKIYLNRDNRKPLKDLNIECCGNPLGRPPKDMQTSEYEKKMARYSGVRNEIEATFSTGNRRTKQWQKSSLLELCIAGRRKTKSVRVYGADNIRGKLADTGELWTAACYFVKNVMKFLRELLHTLFFLLDFLSFFSRTEQSHGKYPALAR